MHLAPCFQQLFLQFPAFAVFAILSAYHWGKFAAGAATVQRNRVQCCALHMRRLVVLLLAGVAAARLYYISTVPSATMRPVFWTDWLLVGAEFVAYVVHAALLTVLLRRGTTNHRGPLAVRVVWITVFMLTVIWTQSNNDGWAVTNVRLFGAVAVFLHVVYAGTLLPDGEAQAVASGAQRGDEVSPIASKEISI